MRGEWDMPNRDDEEPEYEFEYRIKGREPRETMKVNGRSVFLLGGLAARERVPSPRPDRSRGPRPRNPRAMRRDTGRNRPEGDK